MDLRTAEFTALRNAISFRGTTRIVVAAATFWVWASLLALLLFFSDLPLALLIPLAVLVSGFEAVHALHAGVERIGRYLQVSSEMDADGPRWETAAMAVGPALPGGGIDPLFTVVFVGAAGLNLAGAVLAGAIWQELAFLTLCHAGCVLRVLRARTAATRQRPVELESFRAVLRRSHPTN